MRVGGRLASSVLFLLAGQAACATQPVRAPRVAAARTSPAATPASRGAPLRRAVLHYELDGRPFGRPSPRPYVRASVGGRPTILVVDTGASSHVIAGWFAREAGLRTTGAALAGTDFAGRAVTATSVTDPRIVIEGWGPLPDAAVLAVEVPPVLQELGVGGFINPQLLGDGVPGAAVVLDLRAGELALEPVDAAMRRLAGPGAALVTSEVRGCEHDEEQFPSRVFVVPAEVDGQPVRLELDTGSGRSDLFASSSAGRALDGRGAQREETSHGVGGAFSARTVPGVRLRVGDVERSIEMGLVPGNVPATCPRDGVLGMNVLRPCVLVFADARVRGRCGT